MVCNTGSPKRVETFPDNRLYAEDAFRASRMMVWVRNPGELPKAQLGTGQALTLSSRKNELRLASEIGQVQENHIPALPLTLLPAISHSSLSYDSKPYCKD